MTKIQELSETLANQIAAGEVVERPASVVKELLENAIDAGSTQIDIHVEEAGLKAIQVIDNGEGIASEDMRNAFKRHATSKIYNRDDLFRIQTLGFRGEALPSIASVSKVTVESAVENGIGTQMYLEVGKILEEKPSASRKGTNITVADLFYQTPARLKYVKSLQTELGNISDIVNRLAMSHPNIAFRMTNDGHQMLQTNGNNDLKQTIAGIYGLSTAKKMLAIHAEDLDFKITGYVSLPELTRANRHYISLMINGRYIKNYLLNKAIVTGFGSKLMVGRFPIAVINIQMDPLLVDVNVHPTKQEVRLSKEKELMALISETIKKRLQTEQLIPYALDNLGFKQKEKIDQSQISEQMKIDLQTLLSEEEPSTVDDTNKMIDFPEKVDKDKLTSEINRDEPSEVAEKMANYSETMSFNQTSNEEFSENIATNVEEQQEENLSAISSEQSYNSKMNQHEVEKTDKQRFPQLDYIGQMHGTYLLAQSEDGLYIVDQHAAQERIKYEYFRKKIGEVSNDQQELLVPIVLDYPTQDYLKIKERQSFLVEIGIELEEFGANSFVVRAHPTWFPKGEEEQTIRAFIDILLEQGHVDVAKFREATAIMMSCKRSIKANHYLDEQQAKILLKDLAKTENPFNCPHGRPVLIHFTNQDMEKMFKRIQDSHTSQRKMFE